MLGVLLGFLANFNENEHTEGFVRSTKLYDVLQGLRYTPDQIDWALERGIRHGLIEAGSKFIAESSSVAPRVLRITQDGLYHVRKLVAEFTYIDAIVVDVPILDSAVASQLAVVVDLHERINRAEIFCTYLDNCWKDVPTNVSVFDWANVAFRLRKGMSRIVART